MPTCRGTPSASCPNHPKSRGNKGAGRNNQQEILGGAARQSSTCIVCMRSRCLHCALFDTMATPWPADRRSIHSVFEVTVVANGHTRHVVTCMMGLTSAADLEAFLRRSTAL